MLPWLRNQYDQYGQENWFCYQMSDQIMLRPLTRQVKYQIKEENQLINRKIVNTLGLKEQQDYDGNLKLKNRLPTIPTQLPKSQIDAILNRLVPKKINKQNFNSNKKRKLTDSLIYSSEKSKQFML